MDSVWNKYDKDHNGTLDYAEMAQFVKETMFDIQNNHKDFKEPTEEEIAEAIKEFDANQDGKVEKAEMMKFMLQVVNYKPPAK